MIKKIILTLFVLLFMIGCADKSTVQHVGKNNQKLDPSKSVYIATPKDALYGDKVYNGSGATTSQALSRGFAKYVDELEVASKYQPRTEAIAYAKKKNFSYLIYPNILHWEDRATEWSGVPDRLSIKVSIIDTKTSQNISSSIIEGRSGWATFGGDHPQDLLPSAVKELTNNLYN